VQSRVESGSIQRHEVEPDGGGFCGPDRPAAIMRTAKISKTSKNFSLRLCLFIRGSAEYASGPTHGRPPASDCARALWENARCSRAQSMFGDGWVFPQRPGTVARARSAGPCVGRRSESRCLCFLEVLEVFVVCFSLKIVGQKLTTCAELTPTSNCTRRAAVLLKRSCAVRKECALARFFEGGAAMSRRLLLPQPHCLLRFVTFSLVAFPGNV
jgi:hypothetical protein